MKNKAKCKNCGDTIESKFQHDFVACTCFKDSEGKTGFFLDGGPGPCQRMGGTIAHIEFLDEE